MTKTHGLSIGDLVVLNCFPTSRFQARKGFPGIVASLSDSNVYEPAEAHVYFGCLEVLEWYPIKTLSLVPDEER